jgi:hypothetical protein
MYILDTDTITHLHAGNKNVAEHLKSIDDPDIGITIITKRRAVLIITKKRKGHFLKIYGHRRRVKGPSSIHIHGASAGEHLRPGCHGV